MRDCPAFAADLLGDLLAVKLPPFSEARLVDVTLNHEGQAEWSAVIAGIAALYPGRGAANQTNN